MYIQWNRIEKDRSQSKLIAHVDHKNIDSINQVMNEIEKLFENYQTSWRYIKLHRNDIQFFVEKEINYKNEKVH